MIQNSAFKVKTASVPDVSKVYPEPGAFTISEHDGNLYYADMFGWHQAEQPYSAFTYFVEFDGVTQFEFTFQAPLTSTLVIHDGDGTVTEVAGNDATDVTHTTNYTEAGMYYYTIGGDVLDVTKFDIQGEPVTGSINGLSLIKGLAHIGAANTELYGDVKYISGLADLTYFRFHRSNILGDISRLKANTLLTNFHCYETDVHGDLSQLVGPLNTRAHLTNVTFDQIATWSVSSLTTFTLNDCKWSSQMVDDALITLANGGVTGRPLNLGGNNQRRTSRSDAALSTLETAGCTVTVNE